MFAFWVALNVMHVKGILHSQPQNGCVAESRTKTTLYRFGDMQLLKTNLSKVMKSSYYRGVSLWDRFTEEVQRAATKVRFKRQIA